MKKKMNIQKVIYAAITCIAAMLLAPTTMKAQEVSVGSDFVSSYIWRGTNCGGVSIQPSMSFSAGGFSLTAWGSVGFDNSDTKEFDFTAAYGVGGFSVAITDYWFDTYKYLDYTEATSHAIEATLGYDFGPLALSWNTFYAGDDYKADGERAFSTYLEVSAPFKLIGLDFKAEIGATPWEGLYSDEFNVVNIGLSGSKEIKVTETFSIPVFSKMIFNPYSKAAYFVFGISL
jgi:hypothetical protein